MISFRDRKILTDLKREGLKWKPNRGCSISYRTFEGAWPKRGCENLSERKCDRGISLARRGRVVGPTFMWHLPEGRFGGGRARVSHPRAQQGPCRVQRRRRRFPAPRCRSAWRVIRSAVTSADDATASARTKVQVQPTAADRATATTTSSVAASSSAAATSGHANTVLKIKGQSSVVDHLRVLR